MDNQKHTMMIHEIYKKHNMRKLLLLLVLLCTSLGMSANKIYELSAATCSASSEAVGPWGFQGGFSVMASDASKTYQTANGGIKYSAGLQYTITLPEGVSVKHVEIYGYDNYADVDSYGNLISNITKADDYAGYYALTVYGYDLEPIINAPSVKKYELRARYGAFSENNIAKKNG